MTELGSVSDATLDRYLAGEASVAERTQVDAWLAVHPGRSKALELLRGDLTGVWDTNEGWRRLNERIVEHAMGVGKQKRTPTWVPVAFLIAMVIVVAAALFAVTRSNTSSVQPQKQTTVPARVRK